MLEKGSCHCGKVKFEADLDTSKAMACNCSMCGRKGTLLSFVPADKFKLLSGQDSMTDYLFNKKAIHHTFCSTCGVTAFATGKMPDGSAVKAVNVRCIDGIDLDKVEVSKVDGKSF